jgi:hypothetical protein
MELVSDAWIYHQCHNSVNIGTWGYEKQSTSFHDLLEYTLCFDGMRLDPVTEQAQRPNMSEHYVLT